MRTLNALGLKYEDFDIGGKYDHIYDEWVLKNEYPNNDDTWQFFIDQVFNVATTPRTGRTQRTQIRLEIEAMIVEEIRSKDPGASLQNPKRINDVYLFHGSNATLLDDFLVSGTYFTEDLEIALKYGKTIYVFNLTAKYQKSGLFTKTWDGHYVSHSAIHLDRLTVLKVSPKK